MQDIVTRIPFLHVFGIFLFPLIIALLAWTVVIKGFALWKAARNGDRAWFVILLIVNTIGILEVVYLIWFVKDKGSSVPPTSVPTQASSSAPEA